MSACRARIYKPEYGSGNWWIETFGVLRKAQLHVRATWGEAMRVAADWTERGTR